MGVTVIHNLFVVRTVAWVPQSCADANLLRVVIRLPSTALTYYNIANMIFWGLVMSLGCSKGDLSSVSVNCILVSYCGWTCWLG